MRCKAIMDVFRNYDVLHERHHIFMWLQTKCGQNQASYFTVKLSQKLDNFNQKTLPRRTVGCFKNVCHFNSFLSTVANYGHHLSLLVKEMLHVSSSTLNNILGIYNIFQLNIKEQCITYFIFPLLAKCYTIIHAEADSKDSNSFICPD